MLAREWKTSSHACWCKINQPEISSLLLLFLQPPRGDFLRNLEFPSTFFRSQTHDALSQFHPRITKFNSISSFPKTGGEIDSGLPDYSNWIDEIPFRWNVGGGNLVKSRGRRASQVDLLVLRKYRWLRRSRSRRSSSRSSSEKEPNKGGWMEVENRWKLSGQFAIYFMALGVCSEVTLRQTVKHKSTSRTANDKLPHQPSILINI